MYGVMRHPTFSKYFLSVGDWTVRLWAEDLKAPVITSPYQPHELNAGRWSPTRCKRNEADNFTWHRSLAQPFRLRVASGLSPAVVRVGRRAVALPTEGRS